MTNESVPVEESPWARLRRHTPARIGLARAGTGIATPVHLAFLASHAQARAAVYDTLDTAALLQGLEARGFMALALQSAAPDRRSYLLRPDLGRRLSAAARASLPAAPAKYDLCIVIAGGLSAQAVQRHALPLLDALRPELETFALRIAPVAVVTQGRVAIGDEIGAAFAADMAIVLIGERPGLTSPDSLGVYLTWSPRVGRTDAERNCISNIRPEGLGYQRAAGTLTYVLTQARLRRMTGVMLKDETISSSSIAPRSASILPSGGAVE